MRLLIRVVILGLAGYGAWCLYDRYGAASASMRGPVQDFSSRASTAARDAARQVGASAQRAADESRDAVSDATSEVSRAAQDLGDEAERRMGDAADGGATSAASTSS